MHGAVVVDVTVSGPLPAVAPRDGRWAVRAGLWGRARGQVRLLVACAVPVGLLLSLGVSAAAAQDARARADAVSRWQLAVTAEALSARLETQTALGRLAATMATPGADGAGDGLAAWDAQLRTVAAGDGSGSTTAVAWVAAPAAADARSGVVELAAAGSGTASQAAVGHVVRIGAGSVVDALAAGHADADGVVPLESALTQSRDEGHPVLTAPYPGTAATTVDAPPPGEVGPDGTGGGAGGPGGSPAGGAELALVVPVYDGPDAPRTVGERQRRLVGWTVTTLSAAMMLDEVQARPHRGTVVRDGDALLGVVARDVDAAGTLAAVDDGGTHTQTVTMPAGGRSWTLVAPTADRPGPLAWVPFGVSLVGCGLVIALLAVRAASEARAVRLAAERTADLAQRTADLAQRTADLAERTRELESLTRNTPDGFARIDGEGRLRFANEAMRQAAAVPDDGIGQRVADLAHLSPVMDAARALSNHMLALFTGTSPADPDDPRRLISMTAHVHDRWYDVRAVPEAGQDGQVESVLVLARDVTRFREAQSRLAHAASHDSLTGLANRDIIRERGIAALTTSRLGTALVLLDLDRFKLVNDSYGHALGDELLRLAATRVGADLPERAAAGRLGGDEFVVLLPDATRAAAEAAASRLVRAFDEPFTLNGEEFAVGCSVGVVHAEPGTMPWDELLRCADVAMYRAKAVGGSCHQWYEHQVADHARQRLTMAADLRRAADEGELSLVYQPEVDLLTGEVAGVEALMRWTSRTRGPVPPREFIPVAEETGLIAELGSWALRRALADVTAHNRRTGAELRVWVNASARQFTGHGGSTDLVTCVVDALAEAGAPAAWLGVEVTETALADDTRAVPMLRTLRELGVGIAVDDFGTGYSSLSRLHDYPVTLLKIDQSFVAGLGQGGSAGPRAAGVVEAVVALGRSLGADVIAEGVEDRAGFERLRDLGCDLAQGFWFGRPAPLASALTPTPTPSPSGGAF